MTNRIRKPPTRLERNIARIVAGTFFALLVILVPASAWFLWNIPPLPLQTGWHPLVGMLALIYLFLWSLIALTLISRLTFKIWAWIHHCLTTTPREEWSDALDQIDGSYWEVKRTES